ncbi:3-carboxy-cis,cis-muconate cycloisomerase [Glaciihabitans tibetensis]|uniref:3-carboxy-cis,cis-muconate cycloisomerase n=1 Tax=Glaciihabitans tibetensis TaxID=1266600 RepID=A0A2T0VG45_9MICO|nr:lyase family protein [Glaciihabitans tibetensis]PRY69178.1 3-carboxy-cis,cis-muconate cycloisomerase [Glaciihabitans tibetensis]
MIDAGLLDPLAQGTRARELTSDAAFVSAMVETEVALTGALVDAGLAPEWMREVCAGLADAGSAGLDLEKLAEESRGGGNPVIPLLRHLSAVAEQLRDGASDYLHVGATSQDILDTAAMLTARAVCEEVLAQLRQVGAALAALAQTHRATPMAGRTLGQHASPTTFGFVVAGWLDGVTGAITALDRTNHMLPLQYGGSVGTLDALEQWTSARGGTAPSIAAAFAARLGLRLPPISWHTTRAPVLAMASALAGAMAAIGVIAIDVGVLARTEIAELAEGRSGTGSGEGGSSAMPHKNNPVAAVLISAAARRSPHLLGSLYASALSEDQRPMGAWHAEWLPLRDLERTAVASASAAAALVSHLVVDEKRMSANLELTGGRIESERIATVLAASMGRRAAFARVEEASGQPDDSALAALLPSHGRGYVGAGSGDYALAAIDRVVEAFRAVDPARAARSARSAPS